MKNVSTKANNSLLLNKSFIGLLIGLFVVSGIAYGILRDQFKSEESSPPSLASESSMLQGLIKTGVYLKFDDSDFERTIRLPQATDRERGVGYYYAERDMSMLEIANSIKPDKDLKIVIAHYGENLTPLRNESEKVFYSFPYGVYAKTKEINEANDHSYIVKAYDGIIIAASKDYETWNLKSASEMPLNTFAGFNSLERGWNLIATNNIVNTHKSCKNRINTIWKLKKSSYGDFSETDLTAPAFESGKYLAWVYLTGDKNTCEDFRQAMDSQTCINKDLKEGAKFLCLNNNWLPCDSTVSGTSAYSAEFVCNGSEWYKPSANSITINSVLPPSGSIPYEENNSVLVFFNEENVLVGDNFNQISIKKLAGTTNPEKAIERTFNPNYGNVSIKYSALEPLTEYKVLFPVGSLKRNNVANNTALNVTFVTSNTATPPGITTLDCVYDGNVVLNGSSFPIACNTGTCVNGTITTTNNPCSSPNPNACTENGVIKTGDTSKFCFGGSYVSCNSSTSSLNQTSGIWTLSEGVVTNTFGARFTCSGGVWSAPAAAPADTCTDGIVNNSTYCKNGVEYVCNANINKTLSSDNKAFCENNIWFYCTGGSVGGAAGTKKNFQDGSQAFCLDNEWRSCINPNTVIYNNNLYCNGSKQISSCGNGDVPSFSDDEKAYCKATKWNPLVCIASNKGKTLESNLYYCNATEWVKCTTEGVFGNGYCLGSKWEVCDSSLKFSSDNKYECRVAGGNWVLFEPKRDPETGTFSREFLETLPAEFEKSFLNKLKTIKEINPAVKQDLLKDLQSNPGVTDMQVQQFEYQLNQLEALSPEVQATQLLELQSNTVKTEELDLRGVNLNR